MRRRWRRRDAGQAGGQPVPVEGEHPAQRAGARHGCPVGLPPPLPHEGLLAVDVPRGGADRGRKRAWATSIPPERRTRQPRKSARDDDIHYRPVPANSARRLDRSRALPRRPENSQPYRCGRVSSAVGGDAVGEDDGAGVQCERVGELELSGGGRPEQQVSGAGLADEQRVNPQPQLVEQALLEHGAPMVAHPPICDQARVEQELARRAVRPHIVFRTVGNEAVLSMVRAGMGTALLPQLAIPGHDTRPDKTISIHELQPPLPPREIFLLWENGRTHSPLAARAIEIAVNETAKIAEDKRQLSELNRPAE